MKIIAVAFCFLWCVEITVLTLQHRSLPEPKKDDTRVDRMIRDVRTLRDRITKLQQSLTKSTTRISKLEKQVDGFLYKGLIAFLHIGKAGGSSFDKLGQEIADQIHYRYYGKRHFDWSEIEKVREWRDNLPVEVVTMLRHPVQRAVSHFYYWKTLNFTEGTKIVNQTLSEYLFEGDVQNLLDTRDIWQDGQGGVSWLTGTHIAGWVVPKITKTMIENREYQALNITAMLPLAASRLRETKWFGILEDLNRSMILLQHAFNLSEVPTLPTENRNKHKKPRVTEEEMKALESLIPQDMWLYDYAKILFEARWKEFQTGIFVDPAEPPIPKHIPCMSTRFKLRCKSGPMAKYFPA